MISLIIFESSLIRCSKTCLYSVGAEASYLTHFLLNFFIGGIEGERETERE